MVTKKELKGIINGDLVRVCKNCKCEVVYDEDLVTMGYDEEVRNYDCACIVCDEDFDLWETCLVPKDEVKIFITDEDKNHYKKYGHISDEKLDILEKEIMN